MNQQASTNPTENNGIVGSIMGLGAEWAVFGLRCATSALEQSSRSMRLAAKSLATIAKELESNIPSEAVETVQPAETAPDATSTDTLGEPVETREPTVTADPSQL